MALEEIKNYTLIPEGGRAAYFFLHYLLISQYAVENKKWPLDDVHVLSNCKDHNAKWYRFYKDYSRFERECDRFKTNPQLLDEMKDEITAYADVMVEEFNFVWNTLSNQALIEKIDSFCDYYYKILRSSSILRILDLGLIDAFRKKCNEKADEIMRTIAVSDIPSYILQEEISLLSLIIDKHGVVSRKDTSKLVNSFAWIELGYFNEKPKTTDSYVEKIQQMSFEGAQKRLQEINEKQKELLANRDSMIATFDDETKLLARIASYSTHVKDHFKYSINRITYFAEYMFQEVARRTNSTVEYLKDCSPDEVKKMLQGKVIDTELYNQRTSQHILVCINGVFNMFIGKEVSDIEAQYLTLQQTQNKELKGRVASKGSAKGIAKIVLNPDQFKKFEGGDILVVTNTSPDFTIIMKKAAAIVAEEGGLTAHVSVVSREMGVPAIVGVHHATSVIKDGDTVEVDAEKGIVRIL